MSELTPLRYEQGRPMCGVEVEGFDALPKELGRMRVPPGVRYAFDGATGDGGVEVWLGVKPAK